MLKKFMLGFAVVAILTPATAQASDPTACLLYAGCHFDSGTLSWICPDPAIYAMCVGP